MESDYIPVEITHNYDEEHHVFYPKKYGSYQNYHDTYLKMGYTTYLLYKHLALLVKYYESLDEEVVFYIKDELLLGMVALKYRSDILGDIFFGKIIQNDVEVSITMAEALNNKNYQELCLASDSNFRGHLMSVFNTMKTRVSNGIIDSKLLTDDKIKKITEDVELLMSSSEKIL